MVKERKPLVVRDARRHPVLRHNPGVRELGMVAYAGFPLYAEGHVIGTLCAIDDVPREWSPEDLEVIADLAALAQSELDLRAAAALGRLTALTDSVMAAPDLGETLRRAAVEVRRSFRTDAALVAAGPDHASAGLPVRDETVLELGTRLLGRP